MGINLVEDVPQGRAAGQNFVQQDEQGKTNQIVAEATGFGNKETYRQAKFI